MLVRFPDFGKLEVALEVVLCRRQTSCISAAHSPLVIRALCSWGAPMCAMWVLLSWWPILGSMVSVLASGVIGCQAPSCTKWLTAAVGPSHKAAGSGTPGLVLACSRAVLGSRWMTFGPLAFLDLVLACWWVLGWFLTWLTTGSRVSQSWYWSLEWGSSQRSTKHLPIMDKARS